MIEAAPLSASVPAPTRLVIDTAALAANRRAIATRVGPRVEIAAVVKADAYGVGVATVVPTLAREGARTFFVAHVGEGIEVRRILDGLGLRDTRVFVLNGLLAGTEPAYAAHRLSPVLGSTAEIEAWSAFAGPAGLRLDAAIHVDTGMNRHGLEREEAETIARRRDLLAAANATLLMSHFARADEPAEPLNARQIDRFRHARGLFPGLAGSLANSSGVFLSDETHHDLVRPGVAIYGGAIVSGEASPFRPVVSLEATILQVRSVPAGETVGYGGRQTTTRPTRLAIVSVGYADGFHRIASSADGAPGARGFLKGVAVPLFGRISMDLAAVDVTDVADAARGDVVELIGPNVTVQEVGARMGTIDYEVLTSLGRRYTRIVR